MATIMAAAQPLGIKNDVNVIELNGDEWSELMECFEASEQGSDKLTVLHIGDSHIKPGIVTAEVRQALRHGCVNDSDSLAAVSRNVEVECIGINGATYATYLNRSDLTRRLQQLKPQLTIISLGTNEAYGNYGSIQGNIESLLYVIRRACPDVKILLTTPLETQKHRSRGHVIQSGIAEVRDLILRYGKAHPVAVWDFYSVGGGAGASRRWLAAGHMSGDRIHLTSDGYHLQGQLLGKALLRLFLTHQTLQQ